MIIDSTMARLANLVSWTKCDVLTIALREIPIYTLLPMTQTRHRSFNCILCSFMLYGQILRFCFCFIIPFKLGMLHHINLECSSGKKKLKSEVNLFLSNLNKLWTFCNFANCGKTINFACCYYETQAIIYK